MTTRELDRLVSRTDFNPSTKRALKEVRQAIMTGYATDPEIGEMEWQIGIATRGGYSARFHFSMKKVDK